MSTELAQLSKVVNAGSAKSAFARALRERSVITSLVLCGIFSIVTTISIIAVLVSETMRFFTYEAVLPEYAGLSASYLEDLEARGIDTTGPSVSVWEFLTGLQWNPLLGAEKHFGIWPLINGTLLVTVVAMAVALPLGLVTAIWLSEYAPERVRRVLKPILEVIAGIPTVVFGFFAVTVITPAIRFEWLDVLSNPFNIGTYNALSAGIAVGVLCLPIVTSLSEDALRAVPSSLREGSYGLGATRFETSIRVVVPAALSGIIAAFLLAVARAVGETMIVALAAGATPIPLHKMTDPPIAERVEHEIIEDAGDSAALAIAPGGTLTTPSFTVPEGEGLGRVTVEYVASEDHLAELSLHRTDIDTDPLVTRWACCEAHSIALLAENLKEGSYAVRIIVHEAESSVQVTRLAAVMGSHESVVSSLLLPVNVGREVQPMTGYMVQIFFGDASNFGPEYFSSYAVAATLFLMTFLLTVIGHQVRVHFRQEYE